MPVASPHEAHIHILPKPQPSYHSNRISPNCQETVAAQLSPSGSPEHPGHFFSTHSPPLLNLSPNLSPAEPPRNSPTYDLRESTRRRSMQADGPVFSSQLTSQQYYAGLMSEEADRRTESPTRKRRKTNHNVVDLTHSPSPPPSRPWESSTADRRNMSQQPQQRRTTNERSTTPRNRRSPTTRRRARDRNTIRQSESPERRAFQPPAMTQQQQHPQQQQQQLHPAVLPHQAPHHHPFIIDMTQVPVSTPAVTVAPYGIPVCTAAHHIQATTGHHMAQPTWTIPGCTVQFPGCSIQHIPACGIPVPQHLQQHIQPMHMPAHMQHHPSPLHTTHFVPTTQHVQGPHPHHHPHHHQDNDIHIVGERRPGAYHIPSAIHRGQPINPSQPVLLQEPAVHPQPHDIYGPYSRFVRRTPNRTSRWRSIPPPPPYPGLLLHFLAMLGNPPVHGAYRMELGEEAAGVENYEALLHLAERLGEAKSRGLTKAEIEQLPSYRFTADTRDPTADQCSCVVCMCDFEPRQLLRVLPCSHEFHGKCVDKWLKTNRTCPICRADATETASSQSD